MAGTFKGLKDTLVTLEAEIDRLQRQVKVLRSYIADYERTGELNQQALILGQPLADQIENVLAGEGKPLHYSTIYERLLQGNVFVSGREPARNVLAHMSGDKSKRFQSLGK